MVKAKNIKANIINNEKREEFTVVEKKPTISA